MKIMMNWLKEHVLGVVIVVVLLATISVVQLIVYQNNIEGHEIELDALTKEKERLATENRLLNAEKERLVDDVTSLIIEKKQETEQLKLEIEALESKVESAIIPFDFVMVQLKDKGFETPEELLDTLSNENDLIPYDGVLGGTMRWWPTESRIINSEWVLGYFEDGHILGHALLEYQIDEQQNVTWKLIKAILY
jgi:regulator of replication initiation timing